MYIRKMFSVSSCAPDSSLLPMYGCICFDWILHVFRLDRQLVFSCMVVLGLHAHIELELNLRASSVNVPCRTDRLRGIAAQRKYS